MRAFFHNFKKEILVSSASLFSFFLLSKLIKKHNAIEKIIYKPYSKLTKQQILDYLHDFKVESLSLLFDIIALREDLQNLYKKNGEEVTNEFLHQKIFPNFLSSLKKKEIYLMKKHSIKSEDLEYSFRDLYSNDKELSDLKKQINISIENALNGISPAKELSNEILEVVTPKKCYELTSEIMTRSLLRLRDLYVQLKKEGVVDFSLGNSVIVTKSQALNLKKMKEDILIMKGLGNFSQSPVEIFTKAIHRHRDENKQFLENIDGIEENYQKVMEILSQDPEGISDEDIEKSFNTVEVFS